MTLSKKIMLAVAVSLVISAAVALTLFFWPVALAAAVTTLSLTAIVGPSVLLQIGFVASMAAAASLAASALAAGALTAGKSFAAWVKPKPNEVPEMGSFEEEEKKDPFEEEEEEEMNPFVKNRKVNTKPQTKRIRHLFPEQLLEENTTQTSEQGTPTPPEEQSLSVTSSQESLEDVDIFKKAGKKRNSKPVSFSDSSSSTASNPTPSTSTRKEIKRKVFFPTSTTQDVSKEQVTPISNSGENKIDSSTSSLSTPPPSSSPSAPENLSGPSSTVPTESSANNVSKNPENPGNPAEMKSPPENDNKKHEDAGSFKHVFKKEVKKITPEDVLEGIKEAQKALQPRGWFSY